MRTKSSRNAVFLALVLSVPSLLSGTPPGQRREDFVVFLRQFIASTQFRNSRIIDPLPVVVGSECGEDPQKDLWRRDAVAKNLIVPLSAKKLQAEGLSQQLSEISAAEVTLFQFREEADSYLVTYTFRVRRGRWFLVAYEDASC